MWAGLIVISNWIISQRNIVLGYNCEHAMKGELFPLYKVLNYMGVSRSTTNVDLVSMIEAIVFKGAECTSRNVKRL